MPLRPASALARVIIGESQAEVKERMADEFRTEKDSFGELKVPSDAYYGASTQRSIQNFVISKIRYKNEMLFAMAYLKLACAKANNDLDLLDSQKTHAIITACREILKGKFLEEFPLDIFQAGSGTSSNMNMNEVIGNRASELLGGKKGDKLVHPNDHGNKGQSTNDITPSAIRVASYLLLPKLIASLADFKETLEKKSVDFDDILKSGRTHLQDAVPIRLGQEFKAYSTATKKHIQRLEETKKYLRILPIGGNAIGTGINTPKKFRSLIIEHLNAQTNSDFKEAEDGIESVQFLTDIAALSSILKLIAIDLNKIANDFRLMASGPKTGFNEIVLPAVEPGSSIMPGKINPTMCEMMNMVCHQIIGNDTAITLSCASGNLELNTHMPVISHNILESIEILTNGVKTFNETCVKGIAANKEVCERYAGLSPSLATALNPILGYDIVAAIVKESLSKDIPIKELILEKKLMARDHLEKALDPKKLTEPNQ